MRPIVLALALAAAALAASPSFAADGEQLFKAKCKLCHQGAKSGPTGPTLVGVYNRKIASLKDFKYTDGLKAKGALAWNDANLDSFLSGPAKFAPGTRMPIMVGNPEERKAIIGYLKTLKK